jgi:hypothetical protein
MRFSILAETVRFELTELYAPLLPQTRFETIPMLAAKHTVNKSYDILLKQLKTAKRGFCEDVWGVKTCPFQTLTGYSWELMYDHAFVYNDDLKQPFRHLTYWAHMFVSSNVLGYKGVLSPPGRSDVFVDFGLTSYELVTINNARYIYGESVVYVDHGIQVNSISPYAVRVAFPLIVIDARIVPELLKQRCVMEVCRAIHTLFILSSHDGLEHSVFSETDPVFRSNLQESNSPCMHLLHRGYYTFDMFELNFMRLMSDMFDGACVENLLLFGEFISVYKTIVEMTESWESTVRSYVRYIAWERVTRLIYVQMLRDVDIPKTEFAGLDMSTYSYGVYPTYMFQNSIIHTNPSWEGALVLKKDQEPIHIPYSQMVQCMFDYYEELGIYKKVS